MFGFNSGKPKEARDAEREKTRVERVELAKSVFKLKDDTRLLEQLMQNMLIERAKDAR